MLSLSLNAMALLNSQDEKVRDNHWIIVLTSITFAVFLL
jgi:hypothetical protein